MNPKSSPNKDQVIQKWSDLIGGLCFENLSPLAAEKNRLSPEHRDFPWATVAIPGSASLVHIVPEAKPLNIEDANLESRHFQALPNGEIFEANGVTRVLWASCQQCRWQDLSKPWEACPECGSLQVLDHDLLDEGLFGFGGATRELEDTGSPSLPIEKKAQVITTGYLMNQEPAEIMAYFRRAPYWHPWPGPNQYEALERLQEGYPHFAPVFGWLYPQLLLGSFHKEPTLHLRPLLLVGPPGCGKSSFAKALAQILTGDDLQPIHLGENPPVFTLTGCNTSFKMAKPGLFLQARIGREQPCPVLNPTLLLDEIDKLNLREFDPTPALLSVLEQESAASFSDAFVGEILDLSKAVFIATANSVEHLPPALLSRFEVFSIPTPTPEEFATLIVPSIYRKWQTQFLDGTFPEHLDEARLWQVADYAGFESRRVTQVLTNLSVDHSDFWPKITETYLANLNGRLPPPPPASAPPTAPNSSSDIEW